MRFYEVVTLSPGDEAPMRVWSGTSPVEAMCKALTEQADGAVKTYIQVSGEVIWKADGQQEGRLVASALC